MMGFEGRPWLRLHPLSVAVNLVPRAWSLLRSLWPLFLAPVMGGGAVVRFEIVLLAGFFGTASWLSLLHYLTLRYRVTDGNLEIHSGLLHRQRRVIQGSRIQNVELVRNVFQRLAGLVELRIETASGTEVEGMLSALGSQQAEQVVAMLGRKNEPPLELADEPVLVHSARDLMWYGATATRWGAAALVVGLGFEALQFYDPKQILQMGGTIERIGVVTIGIALISGTWLAGVLSAFLRHFGFCVYRRGERLIVSEGLLTRRRVEVACDKVQLVTMVETLPRRLAGFGSLVLETAAAGVEQGGVSTSQVYFPVVDARRRMEVLRSVLPQLQVDPWQASMLPQDDRALLRELLGASVRLLALTAVLYALAGSWALVVVALGPVRAALIVLDHRHRGWLKTESYLIARWGFFHRTTVFLPRCKFQSGEVLQGPIMRRYGLGRCYARVAGSSVALPVLSWSLSRRVLDELALYESSGG